MPSSRADSVNCRSALADRKIVPDGQVALFCEVLQFRREYGEHHDTDEGRTIYYNRLRPLLPKLKFPLSGNLGFALKLILPKQSEYTYICDMHKGLNADFVHQWFKFLALEVGARLEILRSSHPGFVGQHAWDNVIKPLTRLHKMWESHERVQEAFGTFTEVGFNQTKDLISVERQSDGCEACILARVGSHAPTLFALRTAVKSRISLESSARHPHRLRLLRIIEPWIQLWRSRCDYKPDRQLARSQQMRENTRLADELYCKRKRLEIFMHEVKYAQIQKTQHRDSEEDTQDIFYQAENDVIDSYAALRATQRESQLVRSSISQSQKNDFASMLSGEDPYRPKVNPAYHESRYSLNSADNNERVIRGSAAIAADQNVPRRPRYTDSTQTCWADVIGHEANSRNPFTASRNPLERIPERHSRHSDIQSERGSIRDSLRGGISLSKPNIQRHSTVRSVKGASDPSKHSSVEIFDYKKCGSNRRSDAGSLVSQLQSVDIRDHDDRHSAVSSMSSYENRHHREDNSRNSLRDSRSSAWTDASIPVVLDARLSRPFEQPAYDTTTREKRSQYERRK